MIKSLKKEIERRTRQIAINRATVECKFSGRQFGHYLDAVSRCF